MPTLDVRIASSTDDAEESASGQMYRTSSDLELVDDPRFSGIGQIVGLRFTSVNIPAGAIITDAHVQFQTDEVNSGLASLTIRADDSDNAAAFSSISGDVSSRATTDASVAWSPAAWSVVGEAGTGERTAESFEGNAGAAPLLQIAYSLPTSAPSVFTDKDDYSPGETATITTMGFNVGATVTFEVDHVSDAGSDGAFGTSDDTIVQLGAEGHDPWTVTDGGGSDLDGEANGTISTAWYVNPDDSADERFLLTATDTATDQVASATFTDSPTLDVRISASADDAEQRASGRVNLTSNDLELVFDKSDQTVGFRFTGLDILHGATITDAYIQFQADETQSEATSLQIWGEATDNAVAFTRATGNITNRPTTDAAVDWNDLPAWIQGDATPDQRTPNLTAIVQEIVDLHWTPQSDTIAFIISGTGHRTAESFNGNAEAAPLLHIEYESAPANNPPVAVDDSFALAEDTTLNVAAAVGVLANDTDVDGPNPLTAVLDTGPADGTLNLNADGSFTYTPNANFNGTDSFTYFAYDGQANSVDPAATVTINVIPVNDPPVAVDDSFAVDKNTTLTVAAAGVLANDTDVEGNTLNAILDQDPSNGPANGTLNLNADGSFTYTPNANFIGTDSFTYFAYDGTENSAAPATVTLTGPIR